MFVFFLTLFFCISAISLTVFGYSGYNLIAVIFNNKLDKIKKLRPLFFSSFDILDSSS